jgi:hypothetical protein
MVEVSVKKNLEEEAMPVVGGSMDRYVRAHERRLGARM